MKKIPVSLLEFARTGLFGPVQIGQSRAEVKLALGKPDDWGVCPEPLETAGIWKYGDIEFHFADHRLYLICMDSFQVPRGGSRIDLDPWIIRATMKLHGFEAALARAGIAFSRRQGRLDPADTDLITAGGVCFGFRGQNEDGDPPGLNLLCTESKRRAIA